MTSTYGLSKAVIILPLFLCLSVPSSVLGQGAAPALRWRTQVEASLFAVDEQTNLYATTGGKVVKISGTGIPLQTNAICPLSGLAQRDESGNFYFAGSFRGTQDFGGIVLDGGTNWMSVDPSGFLAKYDAQGKLLWAVKYGIWNAAQLTVTSLALNPKGGCYLAYFQEEPPIPPPAEHRTIASFSKDGTLQFESAGWTLGPGPNTFNIGAVTESNFWAFSVSDAAHALPMLISASGSVVSSGVVPPLPLGWDREDWFRGKPVADNLGQVFLAGLSADGSPDFKPQLRKFGVDGSVLWSVDLDAQPKWTLARDTQGIYIGGPSNVLSKFDFDGTLLWQTNYEQTCLSMIVDVSGNQFVSLADGAVGRLTTGTQATFGLRGDGFGANGFQMTVTSPPGTVLQILGSDEFNNWQALSFVTNTTGQAIFIDSAAFGSTSRLYKALRVNP